MIDAEDTGRTLANLRELVSSAGWAALVAELSAEFHETIREWMGSETEAARERLRARANAINWVLGLPEARIAVYASEVEAGLEGESAYMPAHPWSPIPNEEMIDDG